MASVDQLLQYPAVKADLMLRIKNFFSLQFCVMYKSRNNSNIQRDNTIAKLAAMVMNADKGHTVNLNNPDLAICVEIIKVKGHSLALLRANTVEHLLAATY